MSVEKGLFGKKSKTLAWKYDRVLFRGIITHFKSRVSEVNLKKINDIKNVKMQDGGITAWEKTLR